MLFSAGLRGTEIDQATVDRVPEMTDGPLVPW